MPSVSPISSTVEPAAANAAVTREVSSWIGISVRSGPLEGGTEFRFNGRSLGHLHAPLGDVATADLIFPPNVGEALIASGRGRPHPMMPALGWVSAPMGTRSEIANVIDLFRQNYERTRR